MPQTAHASRAPKGTRDFYPPDMAVRRYLESVWRGVSINHGFDEIDGPTFEHLDLYTVKSGPGIVSELFSFRRAGGDVDYALRPEFTPTLARMYAAKAGALPRPTRWFSVCPFFRAERPQRGRLREHHQWNVDIIGVADASADAEILAVAVSVLERLGLTPNDVAVKVSHRHAVSSILARLGIGEDRLPAAFDLLDRRDKIDRPSFLSEAGELGLDEDDLARFDQIARATVSADSQFDKLGRSADIPETDLEQLRSLHEALGEIGLGAWCRYDLGVVRGLAYYTGTVFEVHETKGQERAIAGGGRYDNLVELVGGPPTPAVGIAMGDVVIRLVLEDRGLLEPAENLLPRPDVFLVSAGKEEAERRFRPLLASLRRAGLHVRHSHRETRNVGKLLGEAAKARARCAVILGDELAAGNVVVKDLDSGEQDDAVPLGGLAERLKTRLGMV
ncbi:MAG: histidine--tRNA ligase [Planctomycetota bacterium]|jgi:histidyl-tRNA synthetase